MKKILFVLALVMSAVTMLAVDEHLKFKGVPIDGTLESVTQNLEMQGFTRGDLLENVQILHGVFAGYNNCEIYVKSINGKDLVHTIAVCFETRHSWKQLFHDYMNIKDLLVQKYGDPDEVIEQFNKSYPDEMKIIHLDECRYISIFNLDFGQIILNLTQSGFICLMYCDRKNSRLNHQSILDDL